MTNWTFTADSEAETHGLGQALGRFAKPGLVVAISGDLGAGKTHFVRAVVEGLEGSPSDVSSPTFVLLQHYTARVPVHHADAYRLRTENEFLDLGPDEWLGGNGVTLIEWADRVSRWLPQDHLGLRITVTGETHRHLEFIAHGPTAAEIVTLLAENCRPVTDRQ